MSICDTTIKALQGTSLTIEAHVYEDGHYQVTLVDEDGLEIDSLDGNSNDGNLRARIGLAEDALISIHFPE